MATAPLLLRSAGWITALGLLASGCGGRPVPQPLASSAPDWTTVALRTDTLRMVDAVRHRPIPLVTYAPAGMAPTTRLKLALLNHGYGGTNTDYSFVAKNLVAHGYYVVSLQQDLPTDTPMPTMGTPAVVRRPYWERGVQNMLYVLQELKRTQPALNYRQLLLMGHSNGGDMVMLFAQQHPRLVERVITLDNRRMPLPRTRRPRVLSLRSNDQPADVGVLPTPAEQAQFGMTIVPLPATQHNDMWDGATAAQQQEMNALISEFLAH
ncbi:alpha/beta hydrolase [Hymenobacter setariae]|uniref:Alpha/beta hydrolase n=1 Tax=Hymenobacter setariae TaxID=2594794 RepID=A0A558BMA9_9BACT|nr:alpha/beta hydrolase [Hymenobacter setariae]TVT37651.1 alpha/beta hydrolase [Hymenobacter setariae]